MTSSSKKEVHVGYCGGRACPECHKCNDWYYSPQVHSDCKSTYRVYDNHLGPLVGPLYNWHRRADATCGYRGYPHYVYYAAYHGNCSYLRNRCLLPLYPGHNHYYPNPAIHGPHLCHCEIKE